MLFLLVGPAVNWTQSSEDLTMRLKIDKLKEGDVEKLDVLFADDNVQLKVPGTIHLIPH